MTDPLDLKPSDDKEVALHPCPFCGEPSGISVMDQTSNPYVSCWNKACAFGRRALPVLKQFEWNNAYCWKLLAEKEAEAKEHWNNNIRLVGENERFKAKIQEQADQIKDLVDAGEKLRKYHAFIPDAEAFLKFEQTLDRVRGK